MPTKWKQILYLKTDLSDTDEHSEWLYTLNLPEPLASWDVFSYWEGQRILSMRDTLTDSDILFDIGAEHGWMSVVFATMCNVFLIEPTTEFWPNIKATWQKNTTKQPVGCFHGLIGNKTNFWHDIDYKSFPDASNGELIDKLKYTYLTDNRTDIKAITLDNLVKRSTITPTALTIDVEGAELLVLQGAKKLLENNLKIWISIHPDLMRNYNSIPYDIHSLLLKYGYIGKHLATDHEEHWCFIKKS